ncbi:MAG: hypothetical protein ACFFD1_15150, partial [Candidatus Thorarchaeota archaeon]
VTKLEQEEFIKRNLSDIDNSLNNAVSNASKFVDETVKNLIESMTQLKEEFKNDISSEREKIKGNYNKINDSFANFVNKSTEASNEVLSSSNESFMEYYTSFSNKLEQNINFSKQRFIELGSDLNQTSSKTFNKIVEDIDKFVDEIGGKSLESNAILIQSLIELLLISSEQIEELKANSSENLSDLSEILQKLQNVIQKTTSMINDRSNRLEKELSVLSNSNSENLNEKVNNVVEIVQDQITELINSTNKNVSEFESFTKDSVNNLLTSSEQKLQNQIQEMTDTLSSLSTKISEQQISNSNANKEKINAFLTEVIAISHEITSNVHETFDASYASFYELMDRFESQLNSSSKKVNEKFIKILKQNSQIFTEQNIDPTLGSINNLLSSVSDEFQELEIAIKSNIETSLGQLSNELKKVENNISETIKLSFSEGNDKLNKIFESYQTKLTNQETEQVKNMRDVAQNLIEPLELVETVITDRVSGSINPFRETLLDSIEEQKKQFSQQVKGLETTFGEISSEIKNTNKKVPEIFTSNFSSSENIFQGFHKNLSNELESLENNYKQTLEESITKSISDGVNYLQESHKLYQEDSNELKKELNEYLLTSFNEMQNASKRTDSTVEVFTNLVKTVSDFLMQENERGSNVVAEVKKMIAPADLEDNIQEIIKFSNKRLNIIIPSISMLSD